MNAPDAPRLRLGLILARRFSLSAFAGFVDVLRLAADRSDRSRPAPCAWRVLSESMTAVPSSVGVTVQPDERLGDPGRFDYVAILGGGVAEVERLGSEYESFLRRAAGIGVPLIGVCAGALVLRRLGLMRGYRCSVSRFHEDEFLAELEGIAPVQDEAYVVDRDRLTCSGGINSAALAAWLVLRHVGEATASASLRAMGVGEAAAETTPQQRLPLELSTEDALVSKALALMQQSLDAPLTSEQLAERLGVGRRQLERRFHEALGLAPAAADKSVRVARARLLLEGGERSIVEIASETGFGDVAHLTRAFREKEGATPKAYRRRVRSAVSVA